MSEDDRMRPVAAGPRARPQATGDSDAGDSQLAMERLLFVAKVEKGLQQADCGQTVPHADVRARMAKWLT